MDVISRVVPPLIQVSVFKPSKHWWAGLFWELGPMFGLSQLAMHTWNTPFSVLALQVKARASSFGSFLTLY
jgi:hypothetical protein